METSDPIKETPIPVTAPSVTTSEHAPRQRRGGFNNNDRRGQSNRGPRAPREKSEFDSKVLDIARVARVTGGGKRFSFRATVAVGDGKGRVGVGVAQGKDVDE